MILSHQHLAIDLYQRPYAQQRMPVLPVFVLRFSDDRHVHPASLLGIAADYAVVAAVSSCRLPYCHRKIDNRVISSVLDFFSTRLVFQVRSSWLLPWVVQVYHIHG